MTLRWSEPSFRQDAVALRASTWLGCHSLHTQFRGRCRFSAAPFRPEIPRPLRDQLLELSFLFRQIETSDRQQRLHYRTLADCVDKMRVEHRDFVDLAPQEFLHAKLRDRLRFNEGRRIFQFKISQ